MKQVHFILFNGPMGSGKSTVATVLANQLSKTAILEIEDIRRLVTGNEDNLLAWKVIYRMCAEYLKNGVSILLKQAVASEDFVDRFVRLAKKHRCVIGVYHFRAPKGVLLKRIAQRGKTSKALKALAARNIEKHEKIKYKTATVIDTSAMRPNDVAKLVLNDLRIS
jgi:predicted kinase